MGGPEIIKETLLKGGWIFTSFLLLSSGLKARSNVISYVTVNDSPDSDSSLSSPYSTDTLSALRGNSGPLVEGPGRVVGDGAGTRTIIVPPLKSQLGDCTVAAPASGERLHGRRWIQKSVPRDGRLFLAIYLTVFILFGLTWKWICSLRNVLAFDGRRQARAVVRQGEAAANFFATGDSNLTIQSEQELILLKMTANFFFFLKTIWTEIFSYLMS